MFNLLTTLYVMSSYCVSCTPGQQLFFICSVNLNVLSIMSLYVTGNKKFSEL